MTIGTQLLPHPEWRRQGIRTRITRSEARILQAASDLMAERSYDQITVTAVAERAGVGPATVYNRFGTKGRLLACAVFNPRHGALQAAARRDLRCASTAQAVSGYLRRASRLLAEHRKVTEGFLAALGEVPDPETHLDAMAIISMPRPLAQIIEVGQRRGEITSDIDPLETAGMAMTMLIYYIVRCPDADNRRPADTVCRLLLRGIQTQDAQNAP
jgi:AcrR family transcriptional regulator